MEDSINVYAEGDASEEDLDFMLVGDGENRESISWDELSELGRDSTTNAYYFNQLSDAEKGLYEYEKTNGVNRGHYAVTSVPEEINMAAMCLRAHAALQANDPIQMMKYERGIET